MAILKGISLDTETANPDDLQKINDAQLVDDLKDSRGWQVIQEYLINEKNKVVAINSIDISSMSAEEVKIAVAVNQAKASLYDSVFDFIHNFVEEGKQLKMSLLTSTKE